nr:reverse transcriptase domain-containing protein [Tanacetum cinerariifolium]
MSTRSSARNLFPPLDNPELTIRRRSSADPTLLNDFEMATEGNGDPPVLDLRTMEELCQPSLNGQGGPIAPIAIQVTNFGLKNDMIQQSIKVNGVTDEALRLYLFPHSLTHHALAWFNRLLRNSINTFEQMAKMFLGKYFPPSMVTKLRNEITNIRQRPDESLFKVWERGTFMKRRLEECYDLIENMTAHHYDWDTSPNKVNQQVKLVTPNCKTYGGPHSYNDCPVTVGQTHNVYTAGAYQGGLGTLPGNTITNPKEDLKGITSRSGNAYQGTVIPITSSSLPQTKKALIDVYKGELTLRVGKEAITFNLDQTSRYLAICNDMTVNQIDVIDMSCEEYLQVVLGFSDVIASGNPTPYYDPIVSTSSPTLTPFGDSDFLLEEVDAFLALEDDSSSLEVDHSYFDPEGDNF